MRRYFTLQNDIPNDVSVTTLRTSLNKRSPPSIRGYKNTCRMTNAVPINANTVPQAAVCTQNDQRALLIIQNNSTATTAGDVAPTFYIGFGFSPVIGQSMALAPGVGVEFDVRTPIDAIYVALGPFVNTSGSVVIQGFIGEGAITDPATDTVNITETGQLALLVQQIQELIALQKQQMGIAA